jgi:hypothetical protein
MSAADRVCVKRSRSKCGSGASTASIDYRLDAGRLQEVDEVPDRTVAMADRLDHAPIKRSPALHVKQTTVPR